MERISCGDTSINELKPGHALYTMLLNKKGTIVDDAIVQKIKDGEYYLVAVGLQNLSKKKIKKHGGKSG